MKVWDVGHRARRLFTLQGQPAWAICVAFSPDGEATRQRLGGHTTAKVRAAGTGQEIVTLKGHRIGLNRLGAWSPAWPSARTANDWPDRLERRHGEGVGRRTGQERSCLQGAHASVTCVAFSPDGKTPGQRRRDDAELGIKLWDAATGQDARPSRGTRATSVAWPSARTARRLASASGDQHGASCGTRPRARKLLALKGHTRHRVGSVAFSPDGKRLASVRRRTGRCRLWDAATGQELLHPQGAHRRVWPAWPSARTARRLASGGLDQTVRLWDAADGPGGSCPQGAHGTWSTAWPSAPTASTWPAAAQDQDGDGCGTLATGQERPHPQGTSQRRVTAWPSAPTASAWPAAARTRR